MTDVVIISSGQSSANYIVSSYEELIVSSGGSAFDGLVAQEGVVYVEAGGDVSGLVVDTDGQLFVTGTADAVHLHADVMAQIDGGTVSALVVEAGAQVTMFAGALDRGAVLGEVHIFGGTTSDITVSSGGLTVFGRGVAVDDVTVKNGGTVFVWTDPSFSNVTRLHLESGATEVVTQEITSGERASGFVAVPFGEQIVSAGGVAIDTTLSDNTDEDVFSGGEVDRLIDVGSNVHVNVNPDGLVKNLTLVSGGSDVDQGGTISGLIVSAFGEDVDLGLTKAVTISYAGSESVNTGGVASGVTIEAGGHATVYRGGEAKALVVSSGGELIVSRGGVVSGVVVEAGGTLVEGHGAVVHGLTVESGGIVDHHPAALAQSLAAFDPPLAAAQTLYPTGSIHPVGTGLTASPRS